MSWTSVWLGSLGLVCSQKGHRGTYSFAFPIGYYFPATKEGETTRETLEKSLLLILLKLRAGHKYTVFCWCEMPISQWDWDVQGNLVLTGIKSL